MLIRSLPRLQLRYARMAARCSHYGIQWKAERNRFVRSIGGFDLRRLGACTATSVCSAPLIRIRPFRLPYRRKRRSTSPNLGSAGKSALQPHFHHSVRTAPLPGVLPTRCILRSQGAPLHGVIPATMFPPHSRPRRFPRRCSHALIAARAPPLPRRHPCALTAKAPPCNGACPFPPSHACAHCRRRIRAPAST
jgi:hypothetical protein